MRSTLRAVVDRRGRWDSSDPDRAPPPLPLNPSISNSPITKANVSSNIEKAAALIASRALDTAPSAYTSNPPPPTSPIKEIVKPHHRRLQSVQNGAVSRMSDSIERRSPEKSLRSSRHGDYDDYHVVRTPEQSPTRIAPETPTPLGKNTQSRSDENMPLIGAMVPQRGRQEFQTPLVDVTNNSTRGHNSPSLDVLSSQILNITNIATTLQRDLSSLTKRSKDNASDLLKLQEATNARDEDIRKSLRDLISGLDHKFGSIDSRLLGAPDAAKSTPNLPLYLEDREHTTPSRRSFNVPRVNSPVGFLASELSHSPSVVSVDGAASIAMLEKVLRDMATKDGQDKLMSTFEMAKISAEHDAASRLDKSTNIDPVMMHKLEEILEFMKDMKADSGSRALIKAPSVKESTRGASQMDIYLDDHKKQPPTDNVNEEVIRTLRTVKQSLTQHGGLTNEIKSLVRELRGEVLGMGREIARKLDRDPEVSRDSEVPTTTRQTDSEMAQIVNQGLSDLKKHIDEAVHEKNMQLARTVPSVDLETIATVVQRAMAETATTRDFATEREELILAVKEAWEDCKPEIALEHFGLERDEILVTLKEGLQSYQPQHTDTQVAGITYEEVLEAVRNGLTEMELPKIEQQSSISKDDVVAAIQDCLQNFDFSTSLAPVTGSNVSELSREAVVDAVHEGLSRHGDTRLSGSLSRAELLDTLREGLQHAPVATKEVEFNREDLFDAIKACLEGENNPMGATGERVVETMHEFLTGMKQEFQEYSAANGRDTEQVLDAIKDGLEDLRGEIEAYVDRAAGVTGKHEVIDAVKAGFAAMQVDMEKGFVQGNAQAVNTPELLDAMEKEFEHLRESLRKMLTSADISSDKNEILDAIRDAVEDRESSSLHSEGKEIIQAVREELEHMRTTLAESLINSGSTVGKREILDAIREGVETNRVAPKSDGSESVFSNTSELLDAFQDGVENIRADMQKLKESSSSSGNVEEILDKLVSNVENIRNDIGAIKTAPRGNEETTRGQEVMLHDENGISAQLEALQIMITQLRIKIEAMDMPAPEIIIPNKMKIHPDDMDILHTAMEQHTRKDDLIALHTTLRDVRESISTIPRDTVAPQITLPEVVMPANAACKEDTDAIETLLHNIRAKLDDIAVPTLESITASGQMTSIEDTTKDIRTTLEVVCGKLGDNSYKEDFAIIELSLKDIVSTLENLQAKINTDAGDGANLSRADVEVLESLCLDIKTKLDDQQLSSAENLITRSDLSEISDGLKAFREQFESDNDLTAQAFEARKIEHGGLANKIDDVKSFVAELREEFAVKLTGAGEGISELSKVLGMHHDHMQVYATAAGLGELAELVTKAFDAHIDTKSTSKQEAEERDATLFGKLEDTNSELKLNIEEKFNDLMLKYDDAQLANEARLKSMEDSDNKHSESTDEVKAVVGDLKTLVGSLTSTVSETCEKITEDSRTVFDVVDQSNTKVSELSTSNSHEHSITRNEIVRTLDATTRIEGCLHQQHPAVMIAMQEILDKVDRHFKHSQQQSETFREATEEIKSGVSGIPAAIPPLLPMLPGMESAPTVVSEDREVEKYDDTEMHIKLDQLLTHTVLAKDAYATMDAHHTSANERLSSLDRLDAIHDKVTNAVEEISAMVAKQSLLMAEHRESQADAAREAAIALEKRTAQKEHVEAGIVALTEEKNLLLEEMKTLKREHAELSTQTKRLGREVGKLETALAIRQEEMRDMNTRAETLERRVLEGVVNHARALKMGTTMPRKKKISPSERDVSMSLKRIPSVASTATTKPSVTAPSALGHAVGLALKKRAPLRSNANLASRQSATDRRILSQSHMQPSVKKDGSQALILAPSTGIAGFTSLKRSQSVKSNPSRNNDRKSSWSGNESSFLDKENRDQSELEDMLSSESGIERMTDLSGTSYMYTDSSLSRDTGRSTSYASTMSDVRKRYGRDSILEEDEEEEEEEEDDNDASSVQHHTSSQAMVLAEPIEVHDYGAVSDSDEDNFEDADTVGELPASQDIYYHESKYAARSDSGLGSEPNTPDLNFGHSNTWHSSVSTST